MREINEEQLIDLMVNLNLFSSGLIWVGEIGILGRGLHSLCYENSIQTSFNEKRRPYKSWPKEKYITITACLQGNCRTKEGINNEA